jgi:methylglyoxal synthase
MIALIAHDKKKTELLEFVRNHVEFFRTQKLVATGHTGKLLNEELGLEVERVAHGPEGGDLIIGGRVAEGKSDRCCSSVILSPPSPTSRMYRR